MYTYISIHTVPPFLEMPVLQIKQERINKYQGVNLYVKNLDENLEDDAFRVAFEEYGQITSCKVMRDDKVTPKS